MKRITLPDVTFSARDDDGTPQSISAGQQLYRIVAFPPPQKGLTIDDIRKRLPLCDKLAKTNGNLLLEDSEYAILTEAFSEANWRGVSHDIVALGDALTDAESVEAEQG